MTTIIGFVFGLYDFFIKLSSGKISPVLGPVICQLFSFLSAFTFLLFQVYFWKNKNAMKITNLGFIFAAGAGILITIALISLFFFFTNRGVKVTTALPTILVFRNITLILLGIIILRENLGLTKIVGLILSLIGIYLISG